MDWKIAMMLWLIAIALAVFEIQIEGQHGWAEKLPCWRPKPNSRMQKIYGKLMNEKPLDGFHLTELILLILIFHLPFASGIEWSAEREFEYLAYFFALSITWDFLWFIFNPAYGWKKFNGQNIWWHKHWIGPFPRDYYGASLVIIALIALSAWCGSDFWAGAWALAKNIGGVIGLTAATALVWETTARH